MHHMLLLREQQDATLAEWARDQGIVPRPAARHDGSTGDAIVLTGPAERYPNERQPRPGSSRTGYFQTIIPLPFFPDESELEHLPGPSGLANLRTLAIARLMLDNFPHVKAFWIMQTLEMSQLMLQSGADDIDGTVVWYDITKLGVDSTHQETTVADLETVIREAGFRPIERDTLYRPITRNGRDWSISAGG